jgi:hypothetical protein
MVECITRSSPDIIEGELCDARVELEEERQWLPNATGCTQNCNS